MLSVCVPCTLAGLYHVHWLVCTIPYAVYCMQYLTVCENDE